MYAIPAEIRDHARELLAELDHAATTPSANNDAAEYEAAEDAVIDWVSALARDEAVPTHVRDVSRGLVEALEEAADDVDDYCDAEDGLLHWVGELAQPRTLTLA